MRKNESVLCYVIGNRHSKMFQRNKFLNCMKERVEEKVEERERKGEREMESDVIHHIEQAITESLSRAINQEELFFLSLYSFTISLAA